MDNPYSNPAPYQPTEQNSAAPYPYSVPDSVFAWLSLLFGYLFCRVLPVTEHPLGGFLLIVGLFICAAVILLIKKVRCTLLQVLSALSALVIAAALILTDSDFLVDLSFTYAIACYCYFIYAAFGNSLAPGFSDFAPVDFLKAIFAMPFTALKALFPAIASNTSKTGGKLLLRIVVGLALAFIPTLIILGFLTYDAEFVKLLDKMTIENFDIGSHLASLLFALPLAMYGFGLYSASMEKKLQNKLTAESCREMARKSRIMPQLTAVFAVLPILFVYVVFFISQWQYYVSGFTGVLPENFSYAEYAREGFFQLCSVSVINLIIILAIMLLMRRNASGKAPLLKLLTVIFCLCTLVLISTAVAKLVMYIDMYGLTQKRVYAMWLMAVIALVYIIIALGQFMPRIRPAAASMAVCIILFGALALGNVNTNIAQYNVDRYLSGSLESVDVDALRKLGDSAVPAMVQLLQQAEEHPEDPRYPQSLREELHKYLSRQALYIRNGMFDETLFGFNLPHYRAKQALKEYGFDLEPPKENADK